MSISEREESKYPDNFREAGQTPVALGGRQWTAREGIESHPYLEEFQDIFETP
jgi:hypothetical protein